MEPVWNHRGTSQRVLVGIGRDEQMFGKSVQNKRTDRSYRCHAETDWSSKERPVLGDHPKAHIHEIRWISHEIWWISCEIKRHSLPHALHKTEEFLLSYLIYKVFRWIS